MLKPYFISQEIENSLVDLTGLYDPIRINEFSEFEGIDPLANQIQLQRALSGAFDFVERQTMQFFRPTGARAHYDIVSLSVVPTNLILPGYNPQILEAAYTNGEVIALPNNLSTNRQSNGTLIVGGVNDFITKSKGNFSILYRAGMTEDDPNKSGDAVLSAVQSLAKSYYESVHDPNVIRMVNSTIKSYKAVVTA